MSVEQKIIENSKEPLAALAPRAAKAMNAPDTGVTILVPGARAVIRDCATVAVKYLPIMLFAKMDVDDLRGKITKSEVNDLFSRCKDTNTETWQLLQLMYIKAQWYLNANKIVTKSANDVYNDYDNYVENNTSSVINITEPMCSTICEAFDVK